MVQIKETEVKKFKEHEIEKYLIDCLNICRSIDNGKEEKLENLLISIFLKGFDSGVKAASNVLKSAVKVICEPEETEKA